MHDETSVVGCEQSLQAKKGRFRFKIFQRSNVVKWKIMFMLENSNWTGNILVCMLRDESVARCCLMFSSR